MSQVQNKLENFLADDQLTKTQITDLIALAISIKNHPIDYSQALAGKSVAMIFEKPSLRTHRYKEHRRVIIPDPGEGVAFFCRKFCSGGGTGSDAGGI